MRRGLTFALLLLCTSAVGCGACEPNRATSGADGGTGPHASSAPASASAATQGPSLASHLAHANRLACRAIAVDADVHVDTGADAGTTPLLLQGLVPTEAWLDLGKGARFVAKDPRTTRETTFRGPGRVRACVDYVEESWVESGTFESSVGAGEAPGAEEWVVTPFAVVRYGAGKITVDVRPKDVTVNVASGAAFVWRADDASPPPKPPLPADEGWERIDTGAKAAVTLTAGHAGSSPLGTAAAARAAVARCDELAKASRELAAALLAGADGGTIARQVTTRRLARAACAVATVRVRALPPSSDAAGPLTASLETARSQWNVLPTSDSVARPP